MQTVLLLFFVSFGVGSVITAEIQLINGYPNPVTGTCYGDIFEMVTAPASNGYYNLSTVLSSNGTGTFPFYCIQIAWYGSNLTDITSIGGRTTWVQGPTAPRGLFLAFPIPIDTNTTFMESQAGVIYPVGGGGTNQQNFTVFGAAIVDSLAGYGLQFSSE